MKYKFHKIASIFPLLEGAEFDQLVSDIKTKGLIDPVWLFEGKILDGRNRYRACEEAGVQVETREFKGTGKEAVEFVWSTNRHRRHLNSSQIATATHDRIQYDEEFAETVATIKEDAKEKQKAAGAAGAAGAVHGKEGGRGKKKKVEEQVLVFPSTTAQKSKKQQAEEKLTNTNIAKAAGTNRKYLEAAGKIKQ